jgi:hypothetical protein
MFFYIFRLTKNTDTGPNAQFNNNFMWLRRFSRTRLPRYNPKTSCKIKLATAKRKLNKEDENTLFSVINR